MTQDAIPSILQKIVDTKKSEVAAAKQLKDLATIKEAALALHQSQEQPRRGFADALRRKQETHTAGVIAEIKKASPSKGVICHNFNAAGIASGYEKAGATCLSVLTDEQYFQGSNQYLQAAKQACQLPILRKDFMIDVYQIYESYLLGADCILLIVACLNADTLHRLHKVACELGMDVLIEVHTQSEFEQTLQLPDLSSQQAGQNIYGINNRDLHTFTTDLNTSLQLKSLVPSHTANSALLVTESGIHSTEDMQLMLNSGIYCFLIGEQFMKTPNPADTLGALLDSI